MSCNHGARQSAPAMARVGATAGHTQAAWAKGKIPVLAPMGVTIEVDAGIVARPCRVDFVRLGNGTVMVNKYQHVPEGQALPDGKGYAQQTFDMCFSNETKPPDFDLEWALKWCQDNGYTVRRWQGGARAWRGEPWPVRTAGTIKRMRERGAARGQFYQSRDRSAERSRRSLAFDM